MAEGIISVVVDNLVKVAATEIASLLDLTKELDNLSSEFDAIKNVLQDAETRQIGEESVRAWLQKLKRVAYDLDDLLEEWRICFGDHQVRNSPSSNFTSLIKHPLRHRKYRKRVDEIKSRLEQIAREKERYGFSDDTHVRRMREERRTDSWVDQTSVIARDEDKKTLVSKLISEEGSVTCGNGSDKVATIFILGMGGLGKTTLAKSVFNDERVKEHFDKRMWVCVGEVFDGEVIMKSMIKSLGESVRPSWREQLAEMLKDKLYLLILDDVWNENYEKWERLQEILNQGANESRIVITTRNTGVVAKIRSAYTHELKGLNEDECLSIFKKVVIEPGKEEEYEPLMDIGKEIVGKCGGLPLAVKTIASAVRGRRPTREQWEMVRNSEIWDLKESNEGILPALMLSYTELTPQLKNCFGYCSIFEKDTLLEKDELIRLWVSQGYIVVNDRRREEEEVGEEYFEQLLARSMFQEPERGDDGTVRRCKMHDLVHDLAQWVTKEECRIIGNDDANNNNNALNQLAGARHCVLKRAMSIRDIKLAGVKNLRTFFYSRYGEALDTVLKLLKSVRVLNCRISPHSWKHLGKLIHLRYLNLSGTALTQLPSASIGKLKELRYLNLSYTDIKTLPKNVGTLSSLRQLTLYSCRSLVNLPETIVSLRHLHVINLENCTRLVELPEGIHEMASLRQLNVESCESLVNLPKTIVSLPHLQIINLCGCSDLEALPEGIFEMTSLRRLNIEGCWRLKSLSKGILRRNDILIQIPSTFDRLRFRVEEAGGDGGAGCSRSNIGELAVMNFRPKSLDIFNLEEVRSRDEARTAKLEERSSLCSLDLSWNDTRSGARNVTHVAADGVLEGLRPPPSLVSLKIHNYPGQTFPSWMDDGGAAFRHLREVQLWNCKNCPQLPPLGQLPSLEDLYIAGLDGVARVGREFFGGPSPTFPCLKHLRFQDMMNWSEWVALSPISSEGEERSAKSPIMPALESLEFIDCPKLEAMPPIFTISLRRLAVYDSSPVLFHRSSLQFLSHYETIAIVGSDCWEANFVESDLICVIGEKATEIPDYPGQTFPSWMGDGGAAFGRLRSVELRNCKNCNQLPPLGQLPSLSSLTIGGLDGVERVGREFFGGPSPTFPCLKYLTFWDMRNWSEWVSSEDEEGSAESPIMPVLQRLSFIQCPKLEAMPPIFTTSLRRLAVDDSSPTLYHRSSLQFLPLYETIAIVGDAGYAKSTEDADDALICVVIGTTATELPGSLLLHQTALRMLILADLLRLRSLPDELTQLKDVQQLIIRNSPELSGRCRVGGELRPKIAHIPLILIDGQYIRSDEEDTQSD